MSYNPALKKLLKDVFIEEKKELFDRIDEKMAKATEQKNTRSIVSIPGVEKKEPKVAAPKKGNTIARMCSYLYRANGNPERALGMASDENKDFGDAMIKAMGQGTGSAGGFALAPNYSSELIEELNNNTAFRKMNPGSVPMINGSYTQSFISTGPTAAYVGESQNATAGSATLGQLQMFEKKLVCLVPVSNDLLRNAGPQFEGEISRLIQRKVGQKEDSTFFRSLGVQGEPKGLLYWADSSNKFNANGTVSLANTVSDLGKTVLKLENQNVAIDSGHWAFSARTYWYLMTVTDGNGNFVFADQLKSGMLMGYPFQYTNTIPNNISTNKSEVYFANMADVKLGESLKMEVSVHIDGAYYDGSAVVSGISKDESVIRVKEAHDLGCAYGGKEVAVLEAVGWGV